MDMWLSTSLTDMFKAGSDFTLFLTIAPHVIESWEYALASDSDSNGSLCWNSIHTILGVNISPSGEPSVVNVVVRGGGAQRSKGQGDSERVEILRGWHSADALTSISISTSGREGNVHVISRITWSSIGNNDQVLVIAVGGLHM